MLCAALNVEDDVFKNMVELRSDSTWEIFAADILSCLVPLLFCFGLSVSFRADWVSLFQKKSLEKPNIE